MLKQLERIPGVKWKSPTEPVLDPKALPMMRASTSKWHPNQIGPSKPGKVKSYKKKTKLKKPKEKKTVTQRVIDSLDEYYQTARRPFKFVDFISGLKIDEEEADEGPLPAKNCRVISVTSMTPTKESYTEEIIIETCLATSSMDYESEDDLCFPEEDESDPKDDKSFSFLRKSLGSFLEVASDDE
ncbi:hypothetical protein M5K25_000719 [Dendrobium thyrsiflorum]|uniref:Uncharacterized protein n=1 Tax=Dendrobium thyrsiflorum TaxID=117978 RepID=A0ABD0W6E2_DENTH